MKPKIKICGMKFNVEEVATLYPDYLGFIFYKKSARYFEGPIPETPSNIKKVGVFVNEEIENVLELVNKYQLDVIQLHGEETVEYIKQLNTNLEIWKVFSVDDIFDFRKIIPYENVVDKYLFDTKGKNKGGNGITFNWELLHNYPSKKPFILSGGIGPEDTNAIKNFINNTKLPLYAIDINSRFEEKPGFKNIHKLKHFIDEL